MASIQTIQGSDIIANSRADINTNFANLNSDKIETSVIDTDTTLAANSDSKIPTQKAVKAYIDAGGSTTFPADYVTTSAGAADSGKGVKLNASGVLDSTFMPAEVVTETELQSHTLDIATTATNLGGSGSEVTLYTFTIPSTDVFGVNSGFKLRFYFSRNFTFGSGNNSHIYFKFGGTTILDQSFTSSNVNGWAELYVINQNSTSSQKVGLFERIGGTTNTITGTTSTVATASGTKVVSISVDAGVAGDTYVLSGVILEKIK